MGFSSGTLTHYTRLGRSGKIAPGARVLDFGSQDIYADVTLDLAREFVHTFKPGVPDEEIAKHIVPGMKAEHLMRAAGFKYAAFDVYRSGATRIFDLNFDRLGWFERGRYDLVTNGGTSEHVANQLNCFKVAHDALKVGGVMINLVPFFGGVGHGFVNYHPKFFTNMIKRNGYAALYWGFSDVFNGEGEHYQHVSSAENGAAWEGKHGGMALMCIIWQKTKSAPFVPPIDTGECAAVNSVLSGT